LNGLVLTAKKNRIKTGSVNDRSTTDYDKLYSLRDAAIRHYFHGNTSERLL